MAAVIVDKISVRDSIYVGIDPGASGGIVAIGPDNKVLVHAKCPSTVHDIDDIYRDICELPGRYDGCSIKACIEAVHSMPGQGVKSCFSFGTNYGMHLGLLASNRISYSTVTPHKWMSHFGSRPKDKTARKNHLKQLAQQLYPNTDRPIILATSDAVLIAHYCMTKQ